MRVELQEFLLLVMCVISKFKDNGMNVITLKKKTNAEILIRYPTNGINENFSGKDCYYLLHYL